MDVNTYTTFQESNEVDYFSLRHLLNYVNFMDKARLMNFVDALKCRILDKIGEFDPAYKEELDVLCQLTTECQTENGQKIITQRMLTIINKTSFIKKEESDHVCIYNTRNQHNITQELTLNSLFRSRISRKIESQSESEKSLSINRSSANIYKLPEKHANLENLNWVKENLTEIPSIEEYDSNFSTTDYICIGENGSIKKEMPDSIQSYDSSFSINGGIGARKNGNIKKETQNIRGYNSSFSTNGCISTDKNENIKEILDHMEGYDSSFIANGWISASENGNPDIKEKINASSNYAANNTHLSQVWSGTRIKKHGKCEASAREFVNRNEKKFSLKVDISPSNVDDSTFGHFSLIDLLNYDVDRMPSNELENYACTLKLRLLDKILIFEPSDKEELQVLSKLLDDNPTYSNKKIICSRICALVAKTVPFPKKQRNRKINRTRTRFYQQANYQS